MTDSSLNALRLLYKERGKECEDIIDSLGYYEATRNGKFEDIPLCFEINENWYLLNGFCLEEDTFLAYICDLRTGPPDCGTIDAIAIPNHILKTVLSILNNTFANS